MMFIRAKICPDDEALSRENPFEKWGRELRPKAVSYLVERRVWPKEVDSSAYRLARNEEDISAMGGKAVGDYGEGVAENYLNSRGIEVYRQVWFKGANGRFRADLFDAETRTIYEVKTGRFELGLLGFQIDDCRYALTTRHVKHVVYVNVAFLGRKGFSSELVARLSGLRMITLQ